MARDPMWKVDMFADAAARVDSFRLQTKDPDTYRRLKAQATALWAAASDRWAAVIADDEVTTVLFAPRG